jgi:hypothetical protein
MTDKEAMKLALFALDIVKIHYTQNRHINEAITAIKEALAQPEQEPLIGCVNHDCAKCKERIWVGLTKQQRKEIERQSVYVDGAIRMTEAKLKEKNT